MADDAQSPIRPEVEDAIAFRLAQKAFRYMIAVVTPILALLAFFGYKSFTDVQNDFMKKADELFAATKETEARAESLKALIGALQITLGEQAVTLKQNNADAADSRRRVQEAYDQMVRQAAQTNVTIRDAVGRADGAAVALQDSFRRMGAVTQTRLQRLMADAETANSAAARASQRADTAVRIAEEARLQTVGAGQPQELYGTPYDVSFAGVNRNIVRDLKIVYHNGVTIRPPASVPMGERIPLPNATNPEWYLTVINVLDIPRGLIFFGRSRADAATFRLNRVSAVDRNRSAAR